MPSPIPSTAAAFLLAVVLSTAAHAAPPVDEIRLLAGPMTPGATLSVRDLSAVEARAAALAAEGQERIHVLLQLRRIPDAAQRLELWRQGIDLGAYVPERAWIASLPVTGVTGILRRAEVPWATPWDRELKLHPRVAARDFAPWTRDPERPGWVMLFLQLHHDVEVARGAALAEAHGGLALEPLAGLHGMTVWLPVERIGELAAEEEVLWIEEGPPPLSPNNDGLRELAGVDAVSGGVYGLDGSGVRLFVFDGGAVRADHTTFDSGSGSRVTVFDGSAYDNHPTHVAGTAAGDGNGSRAKGVAPGADVLSAGYSQVAGTMLFWDNAGDIEADYTTARNTHDADLGTNSIGSNTASNGYPCSREGDYGVSAGLLDGIVRGDNAGVGSAVAMTWANGNERGGGTSYPGRCGASYSTTAPPACAKNPIHVGALSSDGGAMTTFSSWGPCDDGRLKPVISAAGCETGRVSGEHSIYSSLATSTTAFGGACGTSMATPGVAGVVSLLIEDWRDQGHGGATDRPLPALIKAMLIQTARDLGPDGPDFVYGYGNVEVQALIDLLRNGSGLGSAGSRHWGTDTVDQGQTDSFTLTVGAGTRTLKATLAWDDAAAAAFSAVALVNDLDLELVAPDATVHRPFVLDDANPHLPATTGVNGLDNQEQVVVETPQAGTWTVRVKGTSVPSGPQSYGLAYAASSQPDLSGGCSEATGNGGFETDTSGWVLSGSAARTAAPAAGHGSFSLGFGGSTSQNDTAYTEVAIPTDATVAEWRYWWWMNTNEGPAHSYDHFYAEVRDTSNAVLAVFDQRSDGWTPSQWLRQENVDLTPWAGQTVRLAFYATNDVLYSTSFWVDDVSLEICTALPVDTLIFSDGFESGDTSAWSSAVP